MMNLPAFGPSTNGRIFNRSRTNDTLTILATFFSVAMFTSGCGADQPTPVIQPVPVTQLITPANATLTAQVASTTPKPDATAASLWTRVRSEDWPRFLNSNHDGKSTETGIRTDWSDGKLPVMWSAAVGTSYGIGSVAAGRYFQHERVGDVERLTALRAETGEPLWQNDHPVEYQDMYGYNNGPRDTPTVVGDDVYTLGVAGLLACTGATDGKTRWTIDTNAEYGVIQNFFGVGTSPLVVDDKVIVMVGGSPPEDAAIAPGRLDRVSPNGSALVAFDRKTGKELWKCGDDLASYSSPRPMTIGDKTIVLALCRDGLLAVDPVSGKRLWHYPHRAKILESVNAIVPVVVGNRVFISDCYEVGSVVLEVSEDSYTVVWQDPDNRRQQSFRCHWATPIVVDDWLYGCSGRNEPDSDLRCINFSTGKLAWSDSRRSRASVMYVDNHFIVLDESGEMQLIRVNPERLEVVTSIDLHEPTAERQPLGRPYWAAPILSHGLLYVRGEERVICLELIENLPEKGSE
jgi:outer membrane protein assembly factor BamB